jgi:hypothetical protein
MNNETEKYPEHEKLKLISKESQVIGKFLEDMQIDGGWNLMRYDEQSDDYEYMRGSINQLLAKYFGIDEKKLEEEKRDILEECRKLSTVKQA